jgi:D-alanine-D-alanine ligase
MSRYRVVVLAGGLSPERDVSLRSGRRVADALIAEGHEATVHDLDGGLLDWLARERPDCAVPLLHGEAGEGGALQEVLELAGVAYVGAPAPAARMAFDKPIAKQVARAAGIRTPEALVLPADMFRELGAGAVLDAVVRRLGLPVFVKPASGGSALGCTAVERAADLPAAMVGCYAYGRLAMIERLVRGIEVAVPVVDTGTGPEALPAVEIRPDGGVYDYAARYTAGATEFVVPATFSPQAAVECARVATAAHAALGLRDLSRSDLIVDASGAVQFLEVNVSPGMTETSLVPLSAGVAGRSLGALYAELVDSAVRRSEESRTSSLPGLDGQRQGCRRAGR